MCGYRLYPLVAIQQLLKTTTLAQRMDFDIDIVVRLYWQGVPTVNLPVSVRYPEDGVSHFRLCRDNVLISLAHAKLFFGMMVRLPSFWDDIGSNSHALGANGGTRDRLGNALLAQSVLGVRQDNFASFFVSGGDLLLASQFIRKTGKPNLLNRLADFAPQLGLTGSLSLSFRHFIGFANSIIDKLAAWSGALTEADVIYHGREPILAQLKTGRGALLLGAHLGNLEVCRLIADFEPSIKINVLVHTKHANKFNQVLNKTNEKVA